MSNVAETNNAVENIARLTDYAGGSAGGQPNTQLLEHVKNLAIMKKAGDHLGDEYKGFIDREFRYMSQAAKILSGRETSIKDDDRKRLLDAYGSTMTSVARLASDLEKWAKEQDARALVELAGSTMPIQHKWKDLLASP